MLKLQKIVRNKWVVGVALLAVVALATVEIRQLRKHLQVQKEIAELTRQAELLQKENEDLQKLSNYLKTEDYVEKAAREQLNKKRDGEYVYSFAEPENVQAVETVQTQQTIETSNLSNPQKWWKYFFESRI